MEYKVLGINSGIGVSLYPFKKHLIGNVEIRGIFHTPKNEQWKANFGDIPLWKKLGPMPMDKNFRVDVIISSPDCGSGSVFRLSRAKEYGDHKDNDSLDAFFNALNFFKPKFFLFENLENLFKSFPKKHFKHLCKGYRLKIHVASVANWGNSQKSRKRLVIVGIRCDLPTEIDHFFKMPHYNDKIKTCFELYGDLVEQEPDVCHVREDIMEIISIHARRRLSLWDIQDHWNTRLDGKKRWETEPGFKFNTAPGVYRNMNNDYPSTARKANRQFAENGLTLTPRQLARIQGVPDTFKIYYDNTKSKYWINKGRCAVTKTPPMEISRWFKKKLTKTYQYLENGKIT
jgi:site-specific DNA-cytosine methylase